MQDTKTINKFLLEQKQRLIDYWSSSKIITNKKVLYAFKKIPRENFVIQQYYKEAYEDRALPIISGQTISQPTTVMLMTQALEVKEGMKILEVGTGSGYQAAILSVLVGEHGKIYTTEIIDNLVTFAKEKLDKCKIKNVKVIKYDGSKGLKKYAPYDRIIITAASPIMPKHLLKQLKKDGILIAPIGDLYLQSIIKIYKSHKVKRAENLGNFVFVPLKGRFGFNNY